MRYAVIVLNWNGGADTVACLESVSTGSTGACPVVVDNGSSDDSVARIERFLAETGMPAVVVRSPENLGFAAGCNLGLRRAVAMGLDICVFLNNDTVVEAGALDRIVARLRDDPGVFVTLPMLLVHGGDRIWNCGGSVSRVGFRRYFHAGARRSAVPAGSELACSFFTGCCFAIRSADFAARGGFTERFFFGEEDIELSLWMHDRGLQARCLTAAVVQHKIGASIGPASGAHAERRLFVHYLNRFIHMRLRLGRLRWALWVAVYVPYIGWLLRHTGSVAARHVPGFLQRLVRCSARMDGVRRADFEALLRGEPPPGAAA